MDFNAETKTHFSTCDKQLIEVHNEAIEQLVNPKIKTA